MDIWPPTQKGWKIIGYSALALVVLALVLFGAQYCSNWRSERQIDKMKANIKTASNEIVNAQSDKAKAEANLAASKQKLLDQTNTYLQAVNATDQGKKQIEQAQNNLNAAINANVPAGTTADDIQRRLEDLDK